MKTNGVETVTHDVLIFGTGLAGLRAAVEIARKSKDTINMALVSKVQIQRPHSVCAEGGSAAVMTRGRWRQLRASCVGHRSKAPISWPIRT